MEEMANGVGKWALDGWASGFEVARVETEVGAVMLGRATGVWDAGQSQIKRHRAMLKV